LNQPEIKLPTAFAERMAASLGADFESFSHALIEDSPVSIRKNPVKYPIGESNGDHSPVPWSSKGVYLNERPGFHLDPLWHAGAYYVQESSSMFLEQIFNSIDLPEDAIVLDACAAPGGKSTHLLSLMGEHSLLVSNELIPKRNLILQENITRWGFANSVITQSKIESFQDLKGFFDLVVVDAPCSGEGLFRKDPKAMREWSQAHVTSCSKRQRTILQDLEDSIRPGGYLIYSTCTYSLEENEDRMEELLRSGYWEQVMIPLDDHSHLVRGRNNIGIRFYPNRIKGEGFYISCLRKSGGGSVSGPPIMELRTDCPESLTNWMDTAGLSYSERNGNGYVFPSHHQKNLRALSESLRITMAGTATGKFVREQLKPSHALALSTKISDSISFISLNLEDSMGWNLVRYKGVVLGWCKVLDRRINNYYPKSLSIRP